MYSLQKPVVFMYFWLNDCNENDHIERILIAVKDIDYLFEIIDADRLHLFLLSDGTRIDNDECLSSLENSTELIVRTEEQIQKLSVYFELKRNLIFKNISYPLNMIISYNAQNNFDIHWSGYKRYMSSLV